MSMQTAFPLLNSEVKREGANLILTIAASVFIWAGVFQVMCVYL
jgi:hypothetical protein